MQRDVCTDDYEYESEDMREYRKAIADLDAKLQDRESILKFFQKLGSHDENGNLTPEYNRT